MVGVVFREFSYLGCGLFGNVRAKAFMENVGAKVQTVISFIGKKETAIETFVCSHMFNGWNGNLEIIPGAGGNIDRKGNAGCIGEDGCLDAHTSVLA